MMADLLKTPPTLFLPDIEDIEDEKIKRVCEGYNKAIEEFVTAVYSDTSWLYERIAGKFFLRNADVVINQFDQSDAPTKLLVVNEIWQPFGATAVFSGFFIVNEWVDGGVGILIQGGGSLTLVSQTTTIFSTTINTASKVNIYLSTNVVTIQNKTASTVQLQVSSIKTRNYA